MSLLAFVQSIFAKRLTQLQAAKQLQLNTRQVKRLVRAYRLFSAAGQLMALRFAPAETTQAYMETVIKDKKSPKLDITKGTSLNGRKRNILALG